MPSATATETSETATTNRPPLKVVFLHMDLGIGGAEQLVLQLASASHNLGHEVLLLTTRCDADHCFASVKPPHGSLYSRLRIVGNWIPPNILGLGGTALCSNLRVLYLALWLIINNIIGRVDVDLVVLDVLPSPLWLLRHLAPRISLLFYCHFPDKLLLRQKNSGIDNNNNKSFYRKTMDALEDACMPLADLILVNSKFTRETVLREFSSLQQQEQEQHEQQEEGEETNNNPLQILYPALDTAAMDSKLELEGKNEAENGSSTSLENEKDNDNHDEIITIVSLNRYERKKKIELLLYAYASIREHCLNNNIDINEQPKKVQLIIAGGYDTKNVENVEYMGELQKIAYEELRLTPRKEVQFLTSVSDAQRTHLLQSARCVVYTPPNEHFGIVPLEVMYAETPVIACNSGGPLETVVDGVTGFLREPTPQAFGPAMLTLIQNPQMAKQMGKAGRRHVIEKFGPAVLTQQWNEKTQEACRKGRERQRQQAVLLRRRPMIVTVMLYGLEALIVFFCCILLTYILRQMGILEPEESIVGSFRRQIKNDEL